MPEESRYRRKEDFIDLVLDLREQIKELDMILRGERDKTGLLAEYERHDEILTRLYAVIYQDPTGQKGLLHDVDLLMGRKSQREKETQFQWHFWTAVAVAMISAMTALITNWDKILKILPQDHPGPVSQMIEKAKHPKSPKKIYRYRVVPASTPGETENPVSPP